MVNLLIKPASGMCNMECEYCFYCDETEKRKQASYGLMSVETAENVLRRGILYAKRSCTIAFQGGEPTLCGLDFFRHIISIAKQYKKPGVKMEFALQTNGYGIDEEWCHFLHDNHFLVGLSVDGVEEIHDEYRHNHQGQGTYRRVLETAAMFDKYQVEYNILIV